MDRRILALAFAAGAYTSPVLAQPTATARDTVRRWRFIPAKRGDEAVSAWVLIPISFRLEG